MEIRKMSRKTRENNFRTFHQGYYIAEIIEGTGTSRADFAERLGMTEKELAELIDGQIRLSDDVAEKLAEFTCTSKEVWMNLQRTYKTEG